MSAITLKAFIGAAPYVPLSLDSFTVGNDGQRDILLELMC